MKNEDLYHQFNARKEEYNKHVTLTYLRNGK
jgi:hypothetical protein